MSTMRRWGVAVLVAGVACWVGFAVGLATTRPEDGANIGAGFLLLLAVPATVTGVVLVATGGRQRVTAGGPASLTPAARPGSVPAGWSLALGILAILAGFFPFAATLASGIAVDAVAAGLSVAAIALGRAGRRLPAAPGVALAGTTTGIVGLVLAVLQLAGSVLQAVLG